MVLMIPVRVWPKHSAEWTTRGFMGTAHRFAVSIVPAFKYRNCTPVIQHEARNIDSTAFAVL
jgi:hypothetical protein